MTTKTWDATSDGNASDDVRWNPDGAPTTEDVVYDSTSIFSCSWDIPGVVLASFLMNTGYSGTVTQAESFACVDWTLKSGVWIGNASLYLSIAGNLLHTGGTFTNFVTNVIMTGSGKTIQLIAASPYINTFRLEPGASVTAITNTIFVNGVYISSGAEFILNSMVVFDWDTGRHFENHGLISGSATLSISFTNEDQTWVAGNITAPVYLWTRATSTGDRTIVLGENTVLGNTLTLYSSSATYKTILSHGSNYTLTVIGALLLGKATGNRQGAMTQGTGRWIFDSYTQNGTSSQFNQGGPVIVGKAFIVGAGAYVGNPNFPTAVGGPISITGGTVTGFLFRNWIINETTKVNRPMNWMMNL